MMLTDEEKIQKAEEIYYRRNGIKSKEINKDKKSHSIRNLFITIIAVLAIIGYKNKDFLLSEEFKSQLKIFLNSKIDINNLWNKNTEQPEITEDEELQTENIEKQDSQEISYEVIWPYKGTITSNFGERESTDKRVTSNHTGIDIAGNMGDEFVSAIDGKVTLISEEGDLGKHIKIENEKITTVYAHCSEIYVKEGDEIKQGTAIGKIGSTGNSTGPHLHFETIKNNEYVDPLNIIENII